MKNLFILTIVIAGSSILFSSCNQTTGISLTKRHYRNGYNLEVSGKPSKTTKKEVQSRDVATIENVISDDQPEFASAESSGENYIKHEPTSFNKYINGSSQTEVTTKRQTDIKPNSKPSRFLAAAKSAVKAPFAIRRIAAENKAINLDDSARRGGGLIWTIIAVLLILWLISLLTGGWGLGGLIHILLVVALVLILLRLIGVI